MEYDYHLSNTEPDTPLEEFARAARAEHRVEDGIKPAKGEAVLSDYELRTWEGWYHRQTLSLIATWFLARQACRGRKVHAGTDGSAGPHAAGHAVA